MDEKERESIRTDLDHTYLVEAGAGTGKTTLLVSRILHALTTGSASLSQIVAITFTEKAAAEIKTRVKEKLRSQANTEDEIERKRISQAIMDIEKAVITTIHGFCSGLLRERPVEARVSPDFMVANETFGAIVYQKTWQQWLLEQIEQKDRTVREFLQIGITCEQMQKMAELVLLHRESFSLQEEVSSPDVTGLRKCLEETLEEMQALSRDCKNEEDRGMQAILKFSKDWEFLRRLDEEMLIRRILYGFNVKPEGNKKNWAPEQSLTRIKELFESARETLHAFAALARHHLTQKFTGWLDRFLEHYHAIKQSRNMMDFEDLLIHTRLLLKHDKEVRGELQKRYRYILVDEFQDTDPLQVEILFFLAEDGPRADSWQEANLKPGKLFLVGDPKQSIYRFRRADIETYEKVKRALGKDCCLHITQNFRCSPKIISWINEAFEKIIEPSTDGLYQPAYTPLFANRPQPPSDSVWFIASADTPPSLPEEKTTISEIVENEAQVIARMIAKMVQERWTTMDGGSLRPVDYGDMAILLRRYTYIENFEQALSRYGIPYQVVGSKSYYSKVEIKSFVTMLRALLEPYHSISVVAVLRSPIFGISDEEIFCYHHHHGNFDYRHGLEKETSIGQAMALLHALHLQSKKLSIPRLIEAIFEKTGILLTFLTLSQGEQRVANLMKALELAHRFSKIGIDDFRSFVEWIGNLEQMEQQESESCLREGDLRNVRIISIHRAKGLEFPVVFLGDLAGKSTRVPEVLLTEEHGPPALKLTGKIELKTKDYDEQAEMEKKRLEAESKRLLYVAATRARDYLVIPTAARGHGYFQWLEPFVQSFHSKELLVMPDPNFSSKIVPPMQSRLVSSRDGSRQESMEERDKWIAGRKALIAKATCHTSLRSLDDMLDTTWGPREILLDQVVHHVLAHIEPLASDDIFMQYELLPLLENQAMKMGLTQAEKEMAYKMLTQAVASPLLLRATKSKSWMRDISFYEKRQENIVEGKIDLCFQEGRNWFIVDYKTDCVPARDVPSLAQHYRPRALECAEAFHRIAQAHVKEVLLFFLRPSVAHAVQELS